ncbi:MAG: hypothetical protein KAX80_04015, partial [Planctomycetes bacterium]|nr:hypothetical protein [Planctomycetota bacterium]
MTNEVGVVTAKKRPLLPRWLKFLLILVGTFFFLAAGAWVLLDIVTRQDLRAALAETRALGWPTEIDGLYPQPIPDEENAALVYEKAFAQQSFFQAYTPLVSQVESLDNWRVLTAEQQALVREALTENAQALALLHQAAQMERCQFDLRYSDGYAMLLPHLSKMRNCVRWERVASMVALADGRTDEALEHWLDSMGMVHHQEGQRILVSELVRLACLSISTETLKVMVQSGQLTDTQLAQATSALRNPDLRRGFADSLKGELTFARGIFTGSFADIKALRGYSGPSDPVELVFGLYSSPFARPWRQQDQATYLMLLKEGIGLAEQPYAAVAKQQRQWQQKVAALEAWRAPLTVMLLPDLTWSSQTVAAGEARRDLARTALALERYRLKQGRYPDALTDLTPDLLPDVPLDPFDGKPLRYANDGTRVVV